MIARNRSDGASVAPRRQRVSILLLLCALSACTDSPTRTVLVDPRSSSLGLSHDDSLQQGYFLQGRSALRTPNGSARDAISSGAAAILSVTPSNFQGFAQPGTITESFSGPVNSVTVTGKGAIFCSGSYGDLVAYDSTHTEIARVALQLIDATDCSTPQNPDNVTFGATATVTVTTGVIASVEITPMSPLAFDVLGVHGGKASATYTTTLGVSAELTLTCTPTAVKRGTPVSCTATMSDGSAPNVTKWNFASSDPELSGYQLDGPPAPTWEGDMVASGTVTVTALVKGAPKEKSVAVAVNPRDWSKDTVEYQINVVPTPYDDPPKDIHQLGSNRQDFRVRFDTYQSVPSGPNARIAYFTKLPYTLSFNVNYNTNAMKVGSVFYNMQPTSRRAYLGKIYCARSKVLSDIPLVKKHEGFSADDANSHTDVYKRFFLQEVRVNAEKLLGADNTSLNPEPVANAAHAVAFAQSHQITDLSQANPYTTDCEFNYIPTLRIP